MLNAYHGYLDRRSLTLLVLGGLAGLPYSLIFSTLSLWLLEAGVERSTLTLFSWTALAYSFKFIWSPLIDALPIAGLARLGRRRSWLLLAQMLMIIAILTIASANPMFSGRLNIMAAGAVLLGFSAATQDIVIDAYRIEIAPDDIAMQSVMSSTYTAGYRLGMIISGAGSLKLAVYLGSENGHYVYEAWRNTYWAMAALVFLGILATIFWIREPQFNRQKNNVSLPENLRLVAIFVLAVLGFVAAFRAVGFWLPETKSAPLLTLGYEMVRFGASALTAMLIAKVAMDIGIAQKSLVVQTWVAPLSDFFQRYGKRAILLLALIGLYRISDIVAGVISNVFYADMGFNKDEIAEAVKTFGVIMSIAGGFAGGLLAQRFQMMRLMMLGAIAAAATNLLFVWLAMCGHNVRLMYFVVSVDNFAAGLAGTVFVAFLSALTSVRFTAVQYALFSSLMSLLPKTLGGYSGTIVEAIGYTGFFLFTAALGIPILILVWLVDKKIFTDK